MKEALINPAEHRETGYRVAQVVDQYQTFEVGQPLFWVDCADDVVADQFWYDPSDKIIKANYVVTVETALTPTKEELMIQLLEIQKTIEKL